jgi:Protein of unknown function (DUF1329)
MRRFAAFVGFLWLLACVTEPVVSAAVKSGDLVTPGNAVAVQDLVSPGNFLLVKQGMRMKIMRTSHLEWPLLYGTATEKYSPQVRLNEKSELENYIAGLPFPLLDPNDPQVATKVMWNFSFRPEFYDDLDIRNAEIQSRRVGDSTPVEQLKVGHFAWYKNVGRTEIPPVPADAEFKKTGIVSRFALFPFLEPAEIAGFGFLRYRNADPKLDDQAWFFNPRGGNFKRVTASQLSDSIGPLSIFATSGSDITSYADNIDPDSYFGFAAKIEDFNYRFFGRQTYVGVRSRRRPSRQFVPLR